MHEFKLTALAIPVQLADGSAFPQRNLILFITFIVILLTLLIQGLSLPYLINKIHLPDYDQTISDEEIENHLRRELSQQALLRLESYEAEIKTKQFFKHLKLKFENLGTGDDDVISEDAKVLYLDVLRQQRIWLLEKNSKEINLNEEIIRKHLTYLDLEEEKLLYI